MATLIPTAVTLQDLMTTTSDINIVNDGIKTQAVSPRTKGLENITVQAKDDVTVTPYISSTADANVLDSVSDSLATFITDGVEVGDSVTNTVDFTSALVTVVVSETVLTLDSDALPLGTETYVVRKPSFWNQKELGGEWIRSACKDGNAEISTYTFPTAGTASTALLYGIIHPKAAANNTGVYTPTGV